ncbi:hypothetical protein ACU686_20380 [Yinghuangia aomiensis]
MTVAGEHASGQIRQTFAAVRGPARRAARQGGRARRGHDRSRRGHRRRFLCGGRADPFGLHRHRCRAGPGMAGVRRHDALVPVCALVGTALATLIRHSAGTVFAVCALFVFVPEALKSPQQDWLVAVANATPWYAWGRLTATGHGHVVGHIPTVTGSWVALAGWAVCSVAAAAVATHAREV